MTLHIVRIYFLFLIAFFGSQSPHAIWAADDADKKPVPGRSLKSAPTFSKITIEEVDDDKTASPQSPFDKPLMPFKVGFEFQESSGLCPWGLANMTLQRKPLFFVTNKGNTKSLWHVVIDTNDIEFVSDPFSDQEYRDLELCMDSMLSALGILEDLLSRQQSIVFQDWAEQITTNLHPNCLISFSPLYRDILHQNITKPSLEWRPIFAPQVTIQHPLSFTIPLYFGIFGFDTPLMLPFCASIPFRDLFEKAQKDANADMFNKIMEGYKKPLSGLMFLHAQTLVRMTSVEDISDDKLLLETLEGLEAYHQVDPKMKLTLMSRRPFSHMLHDLRLPTNYEQTFHQAMGMNFGFRASFNVPELFPKLNYAEQFFDQTTGRVISLEGFLPLFTPGFVETNRAVLMKLLQNGVMSTTMIRNMKEDVVTSDGTVAASLYTRYYQVAVQTVQTPNHQYIVRTNPPGIPCIPSNYDALSPPWFLERDNSMGAYKNPPDANYGEAIVEVRGIKFAHSWFYKKAKLSGEPKGKFLTRSDGQLKLEALAMFRFLSEFGTPQDLADVTLGMSYAILKH